MRADFAEDARNIRLGLASDGFNPFSNMSTNHSTWPVVLIVYNLPPCLCMKESYFIMSLLISGPKSPGNDMDVYLQPLIDELKELWAGVETYDASTNKTFMLHAALMWTINNFPAYGILSGWKTKGYFACPHCNVDTCFYFLKRSRKLCYMGHRRFLDLTHAFRRNKAAFNGKIEDRSPPKLRSGVDLLFQMRKIKVVFGKHNKKYAGLKRKRKDSKKERLRSGWKKRSIFFTLPYWKDHLIRHNIDVMHTEKNVCEALLGTLLDIDRKSKDTLNARFDLQDMKIRRNQHPKEIGHNKFQKPPAPFYLDKKAKENFCKVLSSVKVPDGCASNISRRVDVKNEKVSGLKSHDCHIIMQQLLPLAVRKALPRDISVVLIELSNFFKELCSKNASLQDFEKLEESIVLTLCRLERIFPPSFFDIMVHLVTHLSYEAAVAGLVQYRWMYPIERFLFTLKSYVHNRAKPEGSIAEAYIANECMIFYSRYMKEAESRKTKSSRNATSYRERNGLSIFSNTGHALGSEETVHLGHHQWIQAHQYVLFNCDEVTKYTEEHKKVLRQQNLYMEQSDLENLHKERFVKWFQLQGENIFQEEDDQIKNDLRWLSKGPSSLAIRIKKLNCNGLKFRTKDSERNSPTQNSGICVNGEGGITYHGVLRDIIVLDYYEGRKVFLFKCDWVDLRNRSGTKEDALGFTLVNFKNPWKTNEPYVLASQAIQVCYTPDPVESSWNVVTRIKPRDAYDMDDDELEVDKRTFFGTEPHINELMNHARVNIDNSYVSLEIEDESLIEEIVSEEEEYSDEDDDDEEENSEDDDEGYTYSFL